VADQDNTLFGISFDPIASERAADVALPNFGEELLNAEETPAETPFPQYDVNINTYLKESGEQGMDKTQATRNLARSLVDLARQDPQFEQYDINWDGVAQEDPNEIIRTLVKNVRPGGEKAEIAAEEFTEGLMRGAPSLYAGTKGAVTLAPLGAPAGPLGVLTMGALGFVTGSVLGYTAGDLVVDALTPENLKNQQVAPEDQFTANFFRSTGEFIPGLGLRSFAKPGAEWISGQVLKDLNKKALDLKDGKGIVNRINRITTGGQKVGGKVLQFGERVEKSLANNKDKLSSYTGDIAAIELAALGGAIADEAKPGDPLWKFTGEIAGGFAPALVPYKFTYGLLEKTAGTIKGLTTSRFTEAGRRKSVATDTIAKSAEEKMAEGLDINEAFAFLDDQMIKYRSAVDAAKEAGEIPPTLAQVSDIEHLQKITQQIAENNSLLSTQAKASADEVISKNIEILSDLFEASKVDPEAARLYLQLQEEFYGNMLDTLLAQESIRVTERLNNTQAAAGETTTDMTGEAVADMLNRVFRTAREEEAILWNRVDPNQEQVVSGSNLSEQFQKIQQGLIEGETLNPILAGVPQKLSDETGSLAGPSIETLKEAREEVGRLSNEVSKIIERNPRASAEFDNALDQLRYVSPEGNRDPRTMNLGLADFDNQASEAAQVAQYLEARLAKLGTKGVDARTRKGMEGALRIAQLKQSQEAAKSTVQANSPEGLPLAPTTVGELVRYRSKMLKLARQKSPDVNEAETAYYAKKLADAALEDLNQSGVTGIEYESARAFSRVLNDRFKRSFVGNVIGSKASGEAKISPELVTKKMLTGEGTQVALNIRQTEDAIKFLLEQNPEKYGDLVTESLNTLRTQEDAFMRIALSNIVDEETGLVTASKLNTFLNNQAVQTVLKNNPALRSDLQDLRSAQRVVDSMSGPRPTNDSAKELSDMKAFVKMFTDREDGPTALDSYIGTPEKRPDAPAENLQKLAQLVVKRNKQVEGSQKAIDEARAEVAKATRDYDNALGQGDKVPRKTLDAKLKVLQEKEAALDAALRRGMADPDEPVTVAVGQAGVTKPPAAPKDVREGFKNVVIERAFTFATNAEGKFSAVKFNNYLFRPLASGKNSVITILRNNGLITQREIEHIKSTIKSIEQYSTTTAKYFGPEAVEMIDPTSDGLTALVRGFGARAGQSFFGTGPGPVGGLQAETIGSNLADKLFNRIPNAKRRELFVKMARDPEFLADMYDEFRNVTKSLMIKNQKDQRSALEKAVEGVSNFFAGTLGVRLSGPQVRLALEETIRGELEGGTGDRGTDQDRLSVPISGEPPVLRGPTGPAPAPPASFSPIQQPVAPPPVRQSVPTAPLPQPTPTPPPQAAAPAPQTRQRVAQMFPNDPVLGTNSGIGSLMT